MVEPKDDLRSSRAMLRRISDAERLVKVELGVAGLKETLDAFIEKLDRRLDRDFDEIEERVKESETDMKHLTNKVYFFSGMIAVLGTVGQWIIHKIKGG